MGKLLNIAWKDLKITFRDPAALILLLLTPFGLTLVIGFAFGAIGGGGSSNVLSDIPMAIVNHDSGMFGENLVQVFQSEELGDLIQADLLEDEGTAKTGVDQDRYAAAVIIPENFTGSIIPLDFIRAGFEGSLELEKSVVEVYANPARPVSANVVRSIVDVFVGQVNAGSVGARLSITRLLESGRADIAQLEQIGSQIGEQSARQAVDDSLISFQEALTSKELGDSEESSPSGGFDWLTFTAPSMAILFLMFAVTAGGRSILAERDEGTLPRMLVTPSAPAQVLGGKVLGIFLIGLAQVSILILTSHFLLSIGWGDGRAVALLTLAMVFAATGWGTLIAAYARTPGQANAIGTALTLIFAAGAGNFVPRPALPAWLQRLSYVSPNAWALDGFMELTAGGGLQQVITPAIALLVMGGVLFAFALLAFRRQYA
jgi:ABC-2 type transport system permease protein